MDVSQLLVRMVQIMEAGPLPDTGSLEIHWATWTAQPSPRIRCVFDFINGRDLHCTIYPSIESDQGVYLRTGATWTMDD